MCWTRKIMLSMCVMCGVCVWCLGFSHGCVFAGGLYMYVKHTCVHAPVHAWERGI